MFEEYCSAKSCFVQFPRWSGAAAARLAVSDSVLCRLSGDMRARLEFPLSARGVLRGAYVVDAEMSFDPSARMPVRVEVSPGAFSLGVHIAQRRRRGVAPRRGARARGMPTA